MSAKPPTRAAVDAKLLGACIDDVRALMSAHAGAIELMDVSPQGAVRLRFTGMCAGCPFRPLTMEGTIRPMLESVPGVTAVEAQGARVSEEALARMRRYIGAKALPTTAESPGGSAEVRSPTSTMGLSKFRDSVRFGVNEFCHVT